MPMAQVMRPPVRIEGGHEQGDHGQDNGEGIAEARENGNRIPECFAKYD